MDTANEISIDYYVNCKNKIQEHFSKLDQSNLIELFSMVQHDVPNVQYSKNTNGYFIDIKQLPVSLIQKLEEKASSFANQNSSTNLN